MAEYKNGVNAFGNMSVSKEDRVAEVKTGRAVFVDEDKYEKDSVYKTKVDKCLAEGFHRVGSSEGGGGGSDFSTATVTVTIASSIILTMNNIVSNGVFNAVNGLVSESGEYNTVLYKGNSLCNAINMQDPMSMPTINVTGNAAVQGIEILITGDCTITVS